METDELLPQLLALMSNGVVYIVISALVVRVTNWMKNRGTDSLLCVALFSLVAGFLWFLVESFVNEEIRIAALSAITSIAGYSVLIYEATKKFFPQASAKFLLTKPKE